MTRILRALVLSVLCLLAVTANAGAECAWVLWTEGTSPTSGEMWSPIWAHGTQRECAKSVLEKVRLEVAEAKQRGANVEVLGGPQGNTFITDKGTTGQRITRYVCLPDTVDPRASSFTTSAGRQRGTWTARA